MAEPPSKRKRRGPGYGNDVRTIIARVHQFLKQEYEFMKATNYDNCDLTPLARVYKRTAEAVGVSPRTISRILSKNQGEYEFDFPDFTREKPFQKPGLKQKAEVLSRLDSYELSPYLLRSLIYNYIAAEKSPPSIENLRKILQTGYGFNGGITTLRSLLWDIDFTLYKADINKKVLTEKHFAKMQRFRYLKQIQQYRLENRPIVYTGASVVYAASDRTRYTAVVAGTENGLLPPNNFMILKGVNISRDIYEEWITDKIMPFLPENSVVVVGTEPYNDQLLDMPTAYSKKQEIVAWLEKHSIPFDNNLHKIELYDFFRKNKDQFIIYKTDRCINDAGFGVLRTPSKHPELNPIVSILDKVKLKMNLHEILVSSRINSLIKLEMDKLLANTWKETFENVKEKENVYLKYFDDEVHFNMNLHEDDDGDSEGTHEESDCEKEYTKEHNEGETQSNKERKTNDDTTSVVIEDENGDDVEIKLEIKDEPLE
ncbi:hypothetical protein NE865_07384 [Phthorimaea operculella]|nr:hypothetical protein NE865_07384 [Phthorimaea operculella]